ncbi:unnamed protein product [Rhizophagus irregularis]|uniref:Uncharacterized protein n=1 Tax=Rhizophagus irregularis TaxID=588596 RepID=A0A916EIU5_9GLOM|nr:unnamed protein product [Rhizophagus irregularis]
MVNLQVLVLKLNCLPLLPLLLLPSKAPSIITGRESSYKRSIDMYTEVTKQFANILDRQTKKPKVSHSLN